MWGSTCGFQCHPTGLRVGFATSQLGGLGQVEITRALLGTTGDLHEMCVKASAQ